MERMGMGGVKEWRHRGGLGESRAFHGPLATQHSPARAAVPLGRRGIYLNSVGRMPRRDRSSAHSLHCWRQLA